MISYKFLQWRFLLILAIGIALLQSCKNEPYFKFERGKKMIYQVEYRDSLETLISSEIIEIIGTDEKTHFSEHQDKIFYNFLYSSADSAIFVNYPRLYPAFTYSKSWQETFSQGIIHDTTRLWMHPLRANQYRFTQDSPFPHVVFPVEVGKKWQGFGRTGTDHKTRVISNYKAVKHASYKGLIGEINDCWFISSISDFKGIENKLNMVYHQSKGFLLFDYILHNGDRVTIEFMKEGLVEEADYLLFEKRDEGNR